MFGFHSVLLRGGAQLQSATVVTATGSVAFADMVANGVGNVPVVATGAVTFAAMTTAGSAAVTGRRPLLLRGIPPRTLVARYLLKARNS